MQLTQNGIDMVVTLVTLLIFVRNIVKIIVYKNTRAVFRQFVFHRLSIVVRDRKGPVPGSIYSSFWWSFTRERRRVWTLNRQ